MNRSIHSVLFDFGGVFTSSPFHFVADTARRLGLDPLDYGRLIFGDYNSDTDHPWHRLERGELSFVDASQAISELGRERGIAIDLGKIFSSFPRDGGLRREFIDKARVLRDRGYQLAVVTNNIAEYNEGWRSLFDVDGIFHQIIDSSVEGVRKPNPEIYQLALDRLGCPAPQRSVFLDDFEGNIRAASALGLNTVLVGDDVDQALGDLDSILSGTENTVGTGTV